MGKALNGERTRLVIGTRGSRLALWQAGWVQARLQELAPGLTIEIQRIRTSGDKILDVPLAKIGGKGLFIKEIEEALLRKEVDVAVHSMKDVPSELPSGLAILCVPPREDPHDAWIGKDRVTLTKLKSGAKVGTSSLRRQAQLLSHRSDITIKMLRGNLDTRLRKLQEGEFDAIVLAAAGLKRLGWDDQITELLTPDVSLPAIGQGALGIESRNDDDFVRQLLMPLNHHETHVAISAERALLAGLEGGCQVPIAGLAVVENDTVTIRGLVASVDGKRVIRDQVTGPAKEASQLGEKLAGRLLQAGGDKILNEIYGRA